jgi:hypothetical protein
MNMNKIPNSGLMRNWIRRIVYGMTAIVALFGLILCVYHWESRHALLQYEATLRAKGERLTWAETDFHFTTNGDELRFWRVYASNKFHKPEHVPAMRACVAPGVARVSWQQTTNWELDPSPSSANSAIGITNWDGMEREADENAGILSVFREILKHPAPDLGVHTNTLAFLDDDFDNRKLYWVARGLCATIISDLHRGRGSDVISNLDALIGAADVNRNEPNQQGFRAGIGNLAVRATWEVLQAPNWSDPQLAVIEARWEGTEFASAIQSVALHRRVGVVEEANYLADSRNTNRLEELFPAQSLDPSTRNREELIERDLIMPCYMAVAFNDDMLFLLKYRETQAETVRGLGSGAPWPAVKSALDRAKAESNKWLRKNAPYRFWVSRIEIGIDALPSFFPRLMELETERRMALVAIALRRYEIRHGQLPANLDATVPEFLTKIPMDPMTGKDLSYHLNSDGTFLLYSAGTDGRDDGGDPTPTETSDPPDLWSGRDAVWPAPATDAQIAAEQARLLKIAASGGDEQ